MDKNSYSQENKKTLLFHWNELKYEIHYLDRWPNFREGEIWWCILGENIGVELNGKGNSYLRPVLVFRKFNKYSFYGIPLTSQVRHKGDWYVHFVFNNKEQVAVLHQGGRFSVKRLYRRMGVVTRGDFEKIRRGLESLLFKK